MNTNELMLGNYVYDSFDNKICQITLDDFQCINNFFRSNNQPIPYKPVPLTEKWLLDFEFEKDRAYKKKINFSRFHLLQINAENPYNDNENEFVVNYYQSRQNVQLCRIKFVHQLQNLHFALTGNHLELK